MLRRFPKGNTKGVLSAFPKGGRQIKSKFFKIQNRGGLFVRGHGVGVRRDCAARYCWGIVSVGSEKPKESGRKRKGRKRDCFGGPVSGRFVPDGFPPPEFCRSGSCTRIPSCSHRWAGRAVPYGNDCDASDAPIPDRRARPHGDDILLWRISSRPEVPDGNTTYGKCSDAYKWSYFLQKYDIFPEHTTAWLTLQSGCKNVCFISGFYRKEYATIGRLPVGEEKDATTDE